MVRVMRGQARERGEGWVRADTDHLRWVVRQLREWSVGEGDRGSWGVVKR